MFRELKELIFKHYNSLLFLSSMMCLLAILDIIGIYFLQGLINDNQDIAFLAFEITKENIFIILALLYPIKFAYAYWLNTQIIGYSVNTQIELRSDILSKFYSVSYLNYKSLKKDDWIYLIYQSPMIIAHQIIKPLFTIISDISLSLILVGFVLYQTPKEGIFTVSVIGICMVLYNKMFKSKQNQYGEESNIGMQKLSSEVSTLTRSWLEVLVYNLQNRIKETVEIQGTLFTRGYIKSNVISSQTKYFMETIFVFWLILFIYFSRQGLLRVESISLFILAGLRLIPILSNLSKNMLNIRYNMKAYTYAKEQFELLVSEDYKRIRINEEVLMKGINMSYGDHKVIKDFEYRFKVGNNYLIQGNSGSGKTTLVNILAGLIKPCAGSVTYDTHGHNEVLDFAYVSQSPFIFNTSIVENILLGREFDLERVKELLDLVSLSNYHERLDLNCETLSGGERQRIAIARALYGNESVIIMDEPTSALDSSTTNTILKNILNSNTNQLIVVISHDDIQQHFSNVILL